MNFKSFFYLFFILILASCSAKKESDPVEKTGVELLALGSVNYGGVLVGEQRDAAVQIINHGPSTISVNFTLNNPFSIVSKSVSCSSGTLEAKKDCIITIRFKPTIDGDQAQDFVVQDQKIPLTGKGLTNGYFQLTETSWNVPSMAAGQFRRKRFTIKNLGDLALPGPVVLSRPSYMTVIFNSCEAFVNGRQDCEMEFEARPTEARSFADTIQLRTNSNNILNIGFTTSVVPGSPSGVIQFANAPTSLSAAGAEATITTLPIKDNFGNTVSDGTNVAVNVNANLLVLGGTSYPTVNGTISFSIRTRTIKGNGAISVLSDQASGYITFPILSGQPFGTIGVTSLQNTMPANGTTQLIVSTNLVYDQYLNLVEDGTPIYFELIGSGSLSTGATPKKFTNVTVNGKTNVIIQSGTLAEEMVLKIYGGPIFNTNNEIVGYSATGEYRITQEPGPPFGVIPLYSNKNAIYANNTPPIDLNIPYESIISIGPVVDRFNNIVKPNTQINVNITNGFSTSGSLPESSFILRTDSSGDATFRLVGANNRGFIVSNVTAAQASSSISVWAYRLGQLAYSSGTSAVEVSFLHYRADDKPSPNTPWGKAYRPDNSGQLDNFFYGFNKVSDFPRTDFALNTLFPYFTWDCFFNAQNILITNFCYLPSGEYSGVYNYSPNRQLSIDGLDVSPVPELVLNTNFNINNKLTFWGGPGGLSSSAEGAKWSSSFNGIMWVDNRVTPVGEDAVKNRGISDWITINPTKKYVLTFVVRDQFGTTSDRNAEIGLIEGDPALVSDPNYLNNLPSPILITDTLAGPEIIATIQRFLIVPTGTTDKIKLYFSTKGYGNGAEIKYDDISLKEYVTQNIHDNAVNQAPSIAYMPALDTTLMFGGNSLQSTSYSCDLQNGGSTNDTCYEYTSSSSNRTTLLSSYLDKSDGIVATTFDESYQGNLGVIPPSMGHAAMVGLENKVYLFGGYKAGEFGSATGSLFSFDGTTRRWAQPQIRPDTLVSTNEGAPSPRYQNGLLYVPEKNTLYIAGGLSQNPTNEQSWTTNDDLWKLNLNDSILKWKRICTSCGVFSSNVYPSLGNFQNTIENFPNAVGAFSSYSNAIKNIKRTNMMWHEATQRAYILVPESNVIKYFDPYNEIFMTVDEEDALYTLKDSFQITYNKELGRVYAYKRGSSTQENSKILYWDMNRDEKQYYKYKFNLHPQAKSYVQDLKFTVYAYGKSFTPRIEGAITEEGVEVYVYNQLSQQWISLGTNSAITANDAQQTPIIFRINDATVNQYVSASGHVDLLVTPKGRPGFAGGETNMGNDLNPINIGKDNFNQIFEAKDLITFGQSNCAILDSDTVKCWGVNDFGQLGLGLSTPSVGGTANTIGNNIAATQLFDSSNPSNAGLIATKLFGGVSHACALFNNNKLKCWGKNTYGQLGFNDTSVSASGNKNGKVGDSFGEMSDNLPYVNLGTKDGTPGGPAVEVVDVLMGDNHTCALVKIATFGTTHRVKCWGRNDFGQLGLGIATTQTRGLGTSDMGNNLAYVSFPTFFDSGLMVTRQPVIYEVAAGKNHTCVSAETSTGKDQLYCWGKNTNGELSTGVDGNGNQDYANKISPTITSIQTSQIFSLKSGGDHTCMYYNDTVSTKFYCWGRNDFGQLGRGGSDEPVVISLPQNLQMQFRAIDDVTPNTVNVQFIDSTVPNSTAMFRKISKFATAQNHLIELNHQASQNIADQDFVLEAEIQPTLSTKMAILSKYALSTEVGKVTVTGGWSWYIEASGKMSFFVEGRGLVAESATLNSGFQKVRVVRGFDSVKGYNSIKFFRNVANIGWEEITSPLIDNDLTGLNLSNNTDSPLVIGSVYDNSTTPGPQKGTYYKGNIGYVWMRVGADSINFAPGTVPGSSLLADYVDLGSNFTVSTFALGENHTCVVSTFLDVKCFGANDRGQLGYDYKFDNIGSKIDDLGEALPLVQIGTINGSPVNVDKIDLGLAHSCILLDTGNMKCWGANGFGQLGQGDIKDVGRGLAPVSGENSIFIDFVQLEGVF